MPEFQEDSRFADFYHMNLLRKGQRVGDFQSEPLYLYSQVEKNTSGEEGGNLTIMQRFVYKPTDTPHRYLVYVEYLCIGWFTFEYLIRFAFFHTKLCCVSVEFQIPCRSTKRQIF